MAFAEALSMLFACAGDPPPLKAAQWATVVQRQRYPGMSAVTKQRISDWSLGKRVPQRWESFEPVVMVLIKEAIRRKTPPAKPGMYDLGRWRRWWSEARTASDNAASRSPRTSSAPSTTCPYQGLASFEATDQARFFGRTRAIKELVALITQTHAPDPGIVLVTGPSGAGKSSLLAAGLIPAVSTGALDTIGGGGWVAARMTPGGDPMAELRRCLDHPDVAGRTEGTPVLIVVDQTEEIFAADISPQLRAEFLDVLHTMSQRLMPTPTAVVMGIRSDALGHCVEVPELVNAVKARCMVLEPMSDAELREVVTEPAKIAKLSIEPGLIDLILHDVATENNPAQTSRL
ncbi:MAG: ATP-binding protein, partial [Mycobacterium sp.]|nr:ATP-binding protein [Mycobacterium sp.]